MKLDTTFTRELKKINGDGSREARFAFFTPARTAARELSNIHVCDIFSEVACKYNRTTIAVVLAATIIDRRDRLNYDTVRWAQEVMSFWTNRTPSQVDSVIIRDGIHPTKIEQYAGSFIRCTIDTY